MAKKTDIVVQDSDGKDVVTPSDLGLGEDASNEQKELIKTLFEGGYVDKVCITRTTIHIKDPRTIDMCDDEDDEIDCPFANSSIREGVTNMLSNMLDYTKKTQLPASVRVVMTPDGKIYNSDVTAVGEK